MREFVNQHSHGIQPVITPVVQINANEWVTLELLMAVTGLRKEPYYAPGTLRG